MAGSVDSLFTPENRLAKKREKAPGMTFYFAENFDKFSIVIRCAAIAMVHGVG